MVSIAPTCIIPSQISQSLPTRLAHGIIVPLIYTADDARKLAQAAKFPPIGQRGFGSPFAMGQFGALTASEYLQQANDSLVTIVQIETKEALENVLIPKRPKFFFFFSDNQIEELTR